MHPGFSRAVLGFCGLLLVAGCSTPAGDEPSNVLCVGITADYPPIVFMDGRQVSGLEIDFALLLGKELGRAIEFQPVPWGDQIRALTEGKTDIIMSGVSKTRARGISLVLCTFAMAVTPESPDAVIRFYEPVVPDLRAGILANRLHTQLVTQIA